MFRQVAAAITLIAIGIAAAAEAGYGLNSKVAAMFVLAVTILLPMIFWLIHRSARTFHYYLLRLVGVCALIASGYFLFEMFAGAVLIGVGYLNLRVSGLFLLAVLATDATFFATRRASEGSWRSDVGMALLAIVSLALTISHVAAAGWRI